jgi:tripartite-type tricarboxylate transporter receptor subunit TctC
MPVIKKTAKGLAAALLCAVATFSQAFPDKPVRIVVPYPPSGTTDYLARMLSEKLSTMWKQAVVIENKAGASGNIGMEAVAKGPDDGYTLVFVNSAVTMNGSLYKNIRFDLAQDFAPMGLIGRTPMILAASPASGIKSLDDVAARSKKGGVSYGSCGNGTPQHLAVEMYKSMANVEMMHIPYKGCAPGITDTIGGQVQLFAQGTTAIMPFVKSGQLVPLAQTGATRSAVAPSVPTFAESGVRGYSMDIWYGLLAPKATPAAVQKKIAADLKVVMDSPEVKKLLVDNGIDEFYASPDAAVGVIKTDLDRYASLIKRIGVKAD